jgi:hypothetical protein
VDRKLLIPNEVRDLTLPIKISSIWTMPARSLALLGMRNLRRPPLPLLPPLFLPPLHLPPYRCTQLASGRSLARMLSAFAAVRISGFSWKSLRKFGLQAQSTDAHT